MGKKKKDISNDFTESYEEERSKWIYEVFINDFPEIKDDSKWIAFEHCTFVNCDLSNAKLKHLNFLHCEFIKCNFVSADIKTCIFNHCVIRSTNFHNTKIIDSLIKYTEFTFAKFIHADLSGTQIEESNICTEDSKNITIPQIVPETGSFIGYKKARVSKSDARPAIIKLQVLADAKRSSSLRKCRCSKAKILKIYTVETGRITDKNNAHKKIPLKNSDKHL